MYNLIEPIDVADVILSSDFDTSIITERFIEKSQKKHLAYVLKNLFVYVITEPSTYSDLINGKIYTNNSDIKKQLTGIKETLKYCVYYDLLTYLIIRTENKGIVTSIMRDANIVDKEKLTFLQNDIFNTMQILLQEITDFLTNYSDLEIYKKY